MAGAAFPLEGAPDAFGPKIISEFLACMLSGFLLFSAQANALLPGTKGTGTVGFPWLAISSGLATFFPILVSEMELSPARFRWAAASTGSRTSRPLERPRCPR
jgi:hypothetical protein